MARNHGIIAYGEADDRKKLSMIAAAEKTSGSAWLLKQIRERYLTLFGELPPK